MSSALFHDGTPEAFEQAYFAEETKEARQADKGRREMISKQAEALDALVAVAGYSPDLFKGLHVLLGKTRGKAPDEWARFKDSEAGALLPGDSDVTDSSKAKRWQRWCAEFEEEQARTGKRVMRRLPGKKIIEQGTTKKLCSQYLSELAQMVVDVDRRASQIRTRGLKRVEKLRMAALEIFAALPDYDAPQPKVKLKGKSEPRPPRLAGYRSRALNRFLSAAKQMLNEKKSLGELALDAEVSRLQMELESLAAEMRSQINPEDAVLVHAGNTEWTETQTGAKEPEMVRSNFEAKTQKSRQNEETDEKILDSPVQYLDGQADSPPEPEKPPSVFTSRQILQRARALHDDVVFADSRPKDDSRWQPPTDFLARTEDTFTP
jgi:hypothetical protein